MLLLPALALAVVAMARAAGVPWARLRVLALELALSAMACLYTYSVGRAGFRRARRQRAAGIPLGVRQTEPLWMRADELALALAIGGLLAALPAAFGLPTVSVGVLVTLGLFGAFALISGGFMTPTGLTFEAQGLRMHFPGAAVLVAWEAITHVQAEGPDHFQWVMLHIRDRDAVLASVQPPTERGRKRAEMGLARKGAGATLMLTPWTAGVDGVALERAIAQGRSQTVAPAGLN